MPTPNADDALRTTDHTPVPETGREAVSTDDRRAPSLAGPATLCFQPEPGELADGSAARLRNRRRRPYPVTRLTLCSADRGAGRRPASLPAGEPIRARPVGRIERAVQWARRNPLVAAVLVALLLVDINNRGGL